MKEDIFSDFIRLNGAFTDLAKAAADNVFFELSEPIVLRLDDFFKAAKVLSPEQISVWCAIIEAMESVQYCADDKWKIAFLISKCAPDNFTSDDFPSMIDALQS